MKIIVLTTDYAAFNATGQVFESAYEIKMTQEQIDAIEKLKNEGQLVVKIVLCE